MQLEVGVDLGCVLLGVATAGERHPRAIKLAVVGRDARVGPIGILYRINDGVGAHGLAEDSADGLRRIVSAREIAAHTHVDGRGLRGLEVDV